MRRPVYRWLTPAGFLLAAAILAFSLAFVICRILEVM